MKATGSNLPLRPNMKDERKTKHQLISELIALRRQVERPPPTSAASGRTPAAGKSSNDRFELLFNQSQDALVIIDAKNGNIIDVNQVAGKILGHKKADLVGQKLKDLFSLGSKQDAARLKRQMQIYGTVFTRSYPHPDGNNRFLDLTAAIIPWDNDQAILTTARDVTERKAVEDRLAELFKQVQKSHDDFQSIFNMLNLGIVALDEEGLIRFIN